MVTNCHLNMYERGTVTSCDDYEINSSEWIEVKLDNEVEVDGYKDYMISVIPKELENEPDEVIRLYFAL